MYEKHASCDDKPAKHSQHCLHFEVHCAVSANLAVDGSQNSCRPLQVKKTFLFASFLPTAQVQPMSLHNDFASNVMFEIHNDVNSSVTVKPVLSHARGRDRHAAAQGFPCWSACVIFITECLWMQKQW